MIAVVLALAQEPGLLPAAGPFYARAESELVAGNYAQAAGFYRLVLGQDPGYAPASLGLARALAAAGDLAGAEEVYRGLGDQRDAIEALAAIVEPRSRREALELWRRLQVLGDAWSYHEEARLLLPEDAPGALAAWRTYTAYLVEGEPDADLLLRLADALPPVEAEALLREHPGLRGVAERLERMEVERAAETIALGGSQPLSESQAARLADAMARLRDGEIGGAEGIARELVAAVPRSAEARGLLAEVAIRRGDLAEAESAATLARSLAPDDVAHHLRLARVLADAYGGRRDAEALVELREAAALRPADAEVQLLLGRMEQAEGNWERAARALEVARRDPALAVEADRRLAQLARSPPPRVDLPETAPTGSRAARIALVYLARGQDDRALAEVDAGLGATPTDTSLLNLRARLHRQAGRTADALADLDRSLTIDPTQGAVLLTRGELSDDPEPWFRRAADQGAADAHYLLARLAAERGDWEEVRAQVDLFDARSRGSIYDPGVAALRGVIEEHRRRTRTMVGVATAVGVGAPALLWWRRRSARSLRGLLARAPATGHEVARACAVLRHEVLKHRTTVLPDVADALERGDDAPWEAWRASDVPARVAATLDRLEDLGRRSGVRMDLRHADPVMAPLWRALRLARQTRDPAALRRHAEAINRTGYDDLGRLIAECSVVRVTGGLVRDVYTRVCAEPGFRGTDLPALTVEGEEGLRVRMYADDLQDVLANLLRNALAAGARTLGITMAAATDAVTGVGWVEVRVVDDAPGELTNTMIRGRHVSRGLGIVVDLVHRHGGAVRVEADPKAVVVELPLVET